MNNHPKKKEDLTASGVFTVEPDTSRISEIPGITRLLNRKVLPTSEELAKEGAPVKPAPQTTPQFPKIQSATRRKVTQPEASCPMKTLSLGDLATSTDALQRGLHKILQKTPVQAVFFTGTPLRTSATYEAGAFRAVWQGLSFSGEIFPDLWKSIMSTGFVSMGKSKASDSASRKLFKSLLGVSASDSLIVVYHVSALLIMVTQDEISTVDSLPSAFPFLDASKALRKTG